MPLKPDSARFAHRGAFAKELDAAVDAYFSDPEIKRQRRDLPAMYLKSAIIIVWFVGSWTLLVFFAREWWQGVLAAVSLGLSIAGIGMSVMHDGNHGAYSKHKWVNRLSGAMLDVMGVCSFIWRPKHNIGHHTYTNVEHIDYDLDFGILARLTPLQRRRWYHRYQQFYLWFFYGFLLPKWVFHDDWLILRKRFIGVHKLPKPTRWGLAWFATAKIFFVAWSLVIPALYHPIWQVLVFHLIACFALGMTLGTMFQLAHCNEAAEFPNPTPYKMMSNDWVTHQIETTVDFAPNSRILSWFCGGLNFQVEHHLFPKVCHIHYPALAHIVADVAARHGVRHRSHSTFAIAMRSHFNHLRTMGDPNGLSAADYVARLDPAE